MKAMAKRYTGTRYSTLYAVGFVVARRLTHAREKYGLIRVMTFEMTANDANRCLTPLKLLCAGV